MPIMRELYKLRDNGQLNEAQALWFRDSKPEIELFDTEADPHEINDLADNPNFESVKTELLEELDRWLTSINDQCMIPEEDLLSKFWPEGVQPITGDPVVNTNKNEISLSSPTEGASLGYKLISGVDTSRAWIPYIKPFVLNQGERILAVADRIGYLPSNIVAN